MIGSTQFVTKISPVLITQLVTVCRCQQKLCYWEWKALEKPFTLLFATPTPPQPTPPAQCHEQSCPLFRSIKLNPVFGSPSFSLNFLHTQVLLMTCSIVLHLVFSTCSQETCNKFKFHTLLSDIIAINGCWIAVSRQNNWKMPHFTRMILTWRKKDVRLMLFYRVWA